MQTNFTAPKWLKTISILAIVWNLLGIYSFLAQLLLTPDQIALLPEQQREIIINYPLWGYIVFGVAVFTGTFGSLGLFLKKSWSKPLLLLSLLAVLVQMVHNFKLTEEMILNDSSQAIMPVVVVVIAIALYQIATKGVKDGYLD